MEANITFNIYVMSYKRADKILTKNSVDYCTYVVREAEEHEYRKKVDSLLVIPENAKLKNGDEVNDFMSTFYWIIENTPEDVICIIDDDVTHYEYLLNDATRIDSPTTATEEIERIAQLLVDLGKGFACDYPIAPLYFYDREIAFKGMTGATRWINKSEFKAKYSQKDPASGNEWPHRKPSAYAPAWSASPDAPWS